MKNKIPCSAERLGLLDPQMIQGISEASAFQIGQQYLTESRVRIVEADEAQISAAVIGNSGLYEQTIRLKDNHLISKCSCTLAEEPLCRHCIAVLLEYYRWAQPKPTRKPSPAPAAKELKTPPPTTHATPSRTSTTSSPAEDITLSAIMSFVEWLRPAVKAIEKEAELPDPPKVAAGEVSAWVQMIRTLDDRRRETEDALADLESDMRDREAYVGRLTQQLQTSVAETKAALAKTQELQREITACRGMLTKVTELAAEVVKHEGQVRSVANEILQRGSQLETLAGSFKEVADALKSSTKPAA